MGGSCRQGGRAVTGQVAGPELPGRRWEVELRVLMGLRERPGGAAGTLSRGTREPCQVHEQGRGWISAKRRKIHLGPRPRD